MPVLFLALIDTEEDKQKFTLVYEKYRQVMLKVAYSMVHDYTLAEDCVHDAFVDIAKNFAKVGNPEDTATAAYLLTVVRTCSIRAFHDTENTVAMAPEDMEACEPLQIPATADESTLQEAIAALPAAYREPLLLRYAYGYSAKQTAKLCGISDAAVRKRTERAKLMLLAKLSL